MLRQLSIGLAVSYATLGYDDVVPAPEWRLLGPMAGMNGVLRKVQDR